MDPEAGAGPASAGTSPRVTLVGKPGCHLCDDARAVVARVCSDLAVAWEERSTLDDPELHERYWERIPVVLVDGRPHDYWRVDEQRLRGALAPSQGRAERPEGRRRRGPRDFVRSFTSN